MVRKLSQICRLGTLPKYPHPNLGQVLGAMHVTRDIDLIRLQAFMPEA
jgi:hypothetical protein